MKLNMRHYATIAAVASAFAITAGANAQNNFGFFWKVNYDGLNQTGPWQEQNTADIPGGINGTTKVQLWMRNAPTHSAVNVFIGWGDATGQNNVSRTDAQQALVLGGTMPNTPGTILGVNWNTAITMPGAGAGGYASGNSPLGTPDTNFFQRGGILTATSTTSTNIAGVRPWGLTGSLKPTDGVPVSVDNTGILLMTLTVKNNNLPLFATRPMVVWGSGSGALNTSYLVTGGTRVSFNGSVPLTFRAVPEPGTMIALGAGIAALVARRRKKA